MKQECFNKNVKVKVAILITIILSIFASGCIEPTFEIKNFACQEFINNGSYNTTIINIRNYNELYGQDSYVGIIKIVDVKVEKGFFKNDIYTKITFIDNVTIESNEHTPHSPDGWGQNETYLVITPILNIYKLHCN